MLDHPLFKHRKALFQASKGPLSSIDRPAALPPLLKLITSMAKLCLTKFVLCQKRKLLIRPLYSNLPSILKSWHFLPHRGKSAAEMGGKGEAGEMEGSTNPPFPPHFSLVPPSLAPKRRLAAVGIKPIWSDSNANIKWDAKIDRSRHFLANNFFDQIDLFQRRIKDEFVMNLKDHFCTQSIFE